MPLLDGVTVGGTIDIESFKPTASKVKIDVLRMKLESAGIDVSMTTKVNLNIQAKSSEKEKLMNRKQTRKPLMTIPCLSLGGINGYVTLFRYPQFRFGLRASRGLILQHRVLAVNASLSSFIRL